MNPMRDEELRDLLAAARARKAGGPGSRDPRERQARLEALLPGILKARYGGDDATLSEECKHAAARELQAAAARRAEPEASGRLLNGRRPAWRRLAGIVPFRPLLNGPRGHAPTASASRPRVARGMAAAGVLALVVLVVAAVRGRAPAPVERSRPTAAAAAPAVALFRAPEGAQVPEGVLEPGGVLHLAYGRGGDACYVRAQAGCAAPEEPVRLNRRAGTVALGGEYGPRLALGREGTIHVAWLEKGAGGDAVWYSRSTDGGRTFAPERRILDTPAACDSPALAADAEGNVWVFWLDGRLPPDPRSPLASPIFMARSTDDGRTFAANERVRHDHAGLACACCRLEARVGPDDHLYLSFRSGYRNVRDAYLLRGPKRENAFRSVRISADDWLFAG